MLNIPQTRAFVKLDVEALEILQGNKALGVYCHIIRRTGESGVCWESLDNMAKSCRINIKTLKAHLAKLLELGMITCTERIGQTNEYRLTEPSEWTANPPQKLGAPLPPKTGVPPSQKVGAPPPPKIGCPPPPVFGGVIRSQELDPKELDQNSGGDLTRTSQEQDHDDDFFAEQSQSIAQAPLPQAPLAPKPEPQIISPSVNSIQDLQGQGEAPPVPPPPPKVPPRNPSLAPNPSARVGNGTPWAPLAPWTSREEYDAFKAWLVAANPGKPEGYIHAILIRVEKGDFDNRSWQGFKAGSSPDNTPAGTNTPKEWQDAVQAIFEGLESNPFYATREADRWAESYQQFRRLYSYDSKGQPVRWPAADSWALAQAKAILAAAYPAAS